MPSVSDRVLSFVLPVLDAYTKELAAMCSDSLILLHADHWHASPEVRPATFSHVQHMLCHAGGNLPGFGLPQARRSP